MNAIVYAIADIQQAVVGKISAMDGVAELLRQRRVRTVRAQVGIVRLMTVSPPITFVGPRIGVEHNNAMVAVSVGDVNFIGLRIDENLRGQPEILDIIAAFASAGFPDRHQELTER